MADGDAGDAEDRGLFLDAARVGEDESGMGHEVQEIEVAQGWEGYDLLKGKIQENAAGVVDVPDQVLQGKLLDLLERAGVDGEEDRDALGDQVEGRKDALECLFIVDIGGPVEGEEGVGGGYALAAEPELVEDLGLFGPLDELHQAVDHDIAHEVDLFRGDALVLEVCVGLFAGGEEEVRDLVCEQAVYLLGHGAVEGAEAGLDVGHRDVELGGIEGAGYGGVHVPHDDDEVGALFEQDLFELEHDGPCLLGVGA